MESKFDDEADDSDVDVRISMQAVPKKDEFKYPDLMTQDTTMTSPSH